MASRTTRSATARSRARRSRPRGSYDPDRTRKVLLDSAVALFSEQGFHATSVQEIVEKARVTKGAFYHHFDTKEDVLRLIHDEFLDHQFASLRAAREEFDSYAEQLYEIVRQSVLSVVHYASHVAVYFQERRYLKGTASAAVRAKRDAFEREVEQLLIDGIAAGEFAPHINPRVAMYGIVGMTGWLQQWYRPTGVLSPEEVATMIADQALNGIVARKD